MKYFAAICMLCFFLGNSSCNSKTPSEINTTNEVEKVVFYKSHEPKKADAPFSDAVQVGNLFFLSGQIGMNHTTRILVSGGIETETRQALENIKDVLAQHNLLMSDVVKVTVILDNIEGFQHLIKFTKAIFRRNLHEPLLLLKL